MIDDIVEVGFLETDYYTDDVVGFHVKYHGIFKGFFQSFDTYQSTVVGKPVALILKDDGTIAQVEICCVKFKEKK